MRDIKAKLHQIQESRLISGAIARLKYVSSVLLCLARFLLDILFLQNSAPTVFLTRPTPLDRQDRLLSQRVKN